MVEWKVGTRSVADCWRTENQERRWLPNIVWNPLSPRVVCARTKTRRFDIHIPPTLALGRVLTCVQFLPRKTNHYVKLKIINCFTAFVWSPPVLKRACIEKPFEFQLFVHKLCKYMCCAFEAKFTGYKFEQHAHYCPSKTTWHVFVRCDFSWVFWSSVQQQDVVDVPVLEVEDNAAQSSQTCIFW